MGQFNFKRAVVIRADEAQLNAWQRKYGRVYTLQAEGKTCYLRSPKAQELKKAARKKEVFHFLRTLWDACWLGGDPTLNERIEDGPGEQITNTAAAQVLEQWSGMVDRAVQQHFK